VGLCAADHSADRLDAFGCQAARKGAGARLDIELQRARASRSHCVSGSRILRPEEDFMNIAPSTVYLVVWNDEYADAGLPSKSFVNGYEADRFYDELVDFGYCPQIICLDAEIAFEQLAPFAPVNVPMFIPFLGVSA
jgi:hypothetical protein